MIRLTFFKDHPTYGEQNAQEQKQDSQLRGCCCGSTGFGLECWKQSWILGGPAGIYFSVGVQRIYGRLGAGRTRNQGEFLEFYHEKLGAWMVSTYMGKNVESSSDDSMLKNWISSGEICHETLGKYLVLDGKLSLSVK